jgi:hypothetical protein
MNGQGGVPYSSPVIDSIKSPTKKIKNYPHFQSKILIDVGKIMGY